MLCKLISLPLTSCNWISIVFNVKLLHGMKSVDDVIKLVIISPGAALTGIFLIILDSPLQPIVLKLDRFGDFMYMFLTGVKLR